MHALVIRLNGRAPRVLVYHACDEMESDFTRGLRVNTPPRLLDAHLDFLTAHYNVVPLQALANGGAPERAVAITFDDGYRSVLTGAVPLLRRRSIAATAYVVTDVVDNGALVWVNELCWLLHRHSELARKLLCPAVGLSNDAPVAAVIEGARARWGSARVAAAVAKLRTRSGVDALELATDAALYMTWAELAALRDAGIAIGSHTASHPRLSGLAERELALELSGSRVALAQHGIDAPSVAYPFGDHDADTRRVAEHAGYSSAVAIGGWNAPLDRYAIARVPVDGQDVATLFADLEIVAPVKARVKRLLGRR